MPGGRVPEEHPQESGPRVLGILDLPGRPNTDFSLETNSFNKTSLGPRVVNTQRLELLLSWLQADACPQWCWDIRLSTSWPLAFLGDTSDPRVGQRFSLTLAGAGARAPVDPGPTRMPHLCPAGQVAPGMRRSEPEAELPPFQGPVQGREYSRNKATARCYPALLPSSIFLLLPDPVMGTGLGRGEQGEAATLGAGNR